MKPDLHKARLFRQREAVRLVRAALKHNQAGCHHCGRELQRAAPHQPDYGYVVRGRPGCIDCLPELSQLPDAEAPEADLPRTTTDLDLAERNHGRQRFQRDQEARRLREHLLHLDPHCNNCRRSLQGHYVGSGLPPNYACVVDGVLSCPACVKTVKALLYLETADHLPPLVRPRKRSRPEIYLPPPQTIQAECAAIRATWPADERPRRYVGGPMPDGNPPSEPGTAATWPGEDCEAENAGLTCSGLAG